MPTLVLQRPQDAEIPVAARWLGRILSSLPVLCPVLADVLVCLSLLRMMWFVWRRDFRWCQLLTFNTSSKC